MRSLFTNAPFTRFDLGSHVLSQAVGVGPQTAFSAVSDILSKVGLDPSDISKIQDPKFRAEYNDEYERCKSKGLDSIEGIGCLAALGAKVYAKLSEEEKKPYTPIAVQRPKESGIPWVPIAIGGVAAAGLIYYLATKGK